MAYAQLHASGLATESSRSRAMNRIISMGVETALCEAGERNRILTGTPRASAISGVTLGLAGMPPCPGLAPGSSLNVDHFDLGIASVGGELVSIEGAILHCGSRSSRRPPPRSGRPA